MANKHWAPAASSELRAAGSSPPPLVFRCTFCNLKDNQPELPPKCTAALPQSVFFSLSPSSTASTSPASRSCFPHNQFISLLPLPLPLFSPLSFSASLHPPPSLSWGVMPSVAREPKPRCLLWLLLENRSC